MTASLRARTCRLLGVGGTRDGELLELRSVFARFVGVTAHLGAESRHHVAVQLHRRPVLRPDERLKSELGKAEPHRKSLQGLIFTQSGRRDLTRPARSAGDRRSRSSGARPRKRPQLNPRPPEPHAPDEGTESRHPVVLMRCSGHRCYNSDPEDRPGIAAESEQNSQHTDTRTHGEASANPHGRGMSRKPRLPRRRQIAYV